LRDLSRYHADDAGKTKDDSSKLVFFLEVGHVVEPASENLHHLVILFDELESKLSVVEETHRNCL
jgi:hypothetical protein